MLDERIDPHTAADAPDRPGLLLVDEEPAALALYRRNDDGNGRVVAWVVAMPNGDALLMPADQPGGRPVYTTLANVRRRWADLMDAELVQVAGRQVLSLAS